MTRVVRQSGPWIARRARGAPLGGTTLLVLVTLVLATGQRDAGLCRTAGAEARWGDPGAARQAREADGPTAAGEKPSPSDRVVTVPARPDWSVAMQPLCASSEFVSEASHPMLRMVRVALTDLPPPTV